MKKRSHLVILYLLFAVGVLGHFISLFRPLMLLLTPWMLLLTGAIVIIPVLKERSNRFILWFVVTFGFTFFTEAVGVWTGKVFGPYHYGDVLGFKILEVPLIIGANWVFVVFGSVLIIDRLIRAESTRAYVLKIFCAAALTTLFDFILEPIAIKLGYWTWHMPSIPLQNYCAWFVISLLAVVFYRSLKIKIESASPAHYFFVQALFFIALRFVVL